MSKDIITHLNENFCNKNKIDETIVTKITPETIYKEVKTYINVDFYLTAESDLDRLYASNRLYEVQLNKQVEETCLTYDVDESYIYSDLDIPGEGNLFTLSYIFYQSDITDAEVKEFENNLREDLEEVDTVVRNIIPDLDYEFDGIEIESECKIDYSKLEKPELIETVETSITRATIEDRIDLEDSFDELFWSVNNSIGLDQFDLEDFEVQDTRTEYTNTSGPMNDYGDTGEVEVEYIGKVLGYTYQIDWDLQDVLDYLNKSVSDLTEKDLDLINIANFEEYLRREYYHKALHEVKLLIDNKEFHSLDIEWERV